MDSFVQQIYLLKNTITKIRTQYQYEQSIQLHEFLQQPIFRILQKQGIWKKEYHPALHSFSLLSRPSQPLQHVCNMLSSEEWLWWLEFVVGLKVKCKNTHILRFTHGDYTLQHEKQQYGVHVILELTRQWKTEWGGYTSVVCDGKEKIRIIPIPNSLVIFEQKNGIHQFVKYVNHLVKDERVFVHALYC